MIRVALATLGACSGVDAPPLAVQSYDLGGAPAMVAFESADALVALVEGDAVRLDLVSGATEVLATGLTQLAPLAGGDWVGVDAGGRVLRLGGDGVQTDLFTVPEIERIAASADGQVVAYETAPWNDLLVRHVSDPFPVQILDGEVTLDGLPLATAADGSRFLAQDIDQVSVLWDIDTETGDRAAGGRIHGTLLDVVAAADGFRVALLDGDQLVVHLTPSATLVDQPLVGRWDNAAAFLPDGSAVLTVELRSCGACDLGVVQLVRYDGAGATVLGQGEGEVGTPEAVAASADGALALSTDRGVRVLTVGR